ncbi:MAG: DsbE family thiol:disulfide interchange protein, partial [Magnetococcales bacterium]|nr:DsbE family thiol:disulfide interchange protein [Magnetococcales bacterium]
LILLVAVVGILVLFGLGLGNDPRHIPSPLVGQPAPEIRGDNLGGGDQVVLSSYRGRWVMVNFWGSWCVSCISEHPHLIQLYAKVRNRKDFAIIGVDFKDTVAGARAFLARHGDPGYPQAFDPGQKVAIDWGVYGAPESFLVDPQGIVRYKQTGPIYEGWFEKVVVPLMNQWQVKQ